MKEDPAERAEKYAQSTSASLARLKLKPAPVLISGPQLDRIVETIRSYVKDAKYYADQQKQVTSLACIAYAEGLLDALKFLDLGDF